MKENFIVNAAVRADQGKGASRRLRREGKVPAILYGGKEQPVPLTINHNELWKHLKTEAFYSHILTVNLDGKPEQAVLKDLHRHPVKDQILHLDLLRVEADKLLRMQVPLHFKGGDVAPGVKTAGGMVEHHLNQVEVECLPRNLPEFIEVDLSSLELGDTVHLSQLQLPEGVNLVELKHGNDASVVVIHLPRVVEEEEPAAPAEGEAAPAEVPAANQKAPAAAPAADAGKKDDKKK